MIAQLLADPIAKLPIPLAQTGFWFPPGGSTGARQVDSLFFFILGISIIFFALIVTLMVAFTVLYRRRPDQVEKPTSSHNNLLEIVWSVIPAILVAVIFVWGFFGYMNLKQPPENSYEIQVIGKKWAWQFVYPNGYIDNQLNVPVDRPVLLVMSSDDVIHSLFIPAFRIKQDLVPGRYTKTWFQATKPGKFDLFCAEYCGTEHSGMISKVVVHEPGQFEPWLEDASNFLDKLPPEEAGERLYTIRGCAQCHSSDGSARVGPTFKGIWGASHKFTSGESTVVDENYVRESILEPQAKVRSGYNPVMPTYQGQITDPEINAIIAYIKSLQ